MILFLLDYFKAQWGMKAPMVFSYYSTRMMLAALTSLALVICLGPAFIRLLQRLKTNPGIRTEDCPVACQHESKKNTPTMGGVLILFSMFTSLFLWMDLSHIFTLILLITTVFLGGLGACDDYLKLRYKNGKGVAGRKKLLCQGALALFLSLYFLYPPFAKAVVIENWFRPPVIKEQIHMVVEGISTTQLVPLTLQEYASRFYMPFVKGPVAQLSGVFLFIVPLFTMCVVAGSSNGVNLTDGLDGLATGCLIMVASCLALFSFMSNNVDIASYLNILYVEGSGEIAIYLSAFVGACIGFLWYNGHPAQLFMGDTGSLALGGILGVSAVLLKREMLLALVGGIFVVETLSVILQVISYKKRKKRIFLCAPIHHHFECRGWPETKVVLRFWIVGLLLAILGIASLKFQ